MPLLEKPITLHDLYRADFAEDGLDPQFTYGLENDPAISDYLQAAAEVILAHGSWDPVTGLPTIAPAGQTQLDTLRAPLQHLPNVIGVMSDYVTEPPAGSVSWAEQLTQEFESQLRKHLFQDHSGRFIEDTEIAALFASPVAPVSLQAPGPDDGPFTFIAHGIEKQLSKLGETLKSDFRGPLPWTIGARRAAQSLQKLAADLRETDLQSLSPDEQASAISGYITQLWDAAKQLDAAYDKQEIAIRSRFALHGVSESLIGKANVKAEQAPTTISYDLFHSQATLLQLQLERERAKPSLSGGEDDELWQMLVNRPALTGRAASRA